MTDATRLTTTARRPRRCSRGPAARTASATRGRLRVYLGMAPGVGKTYRMLEEGHRRTKRGTDLVVGFVEAHGRPETEKLLDGLEIVPRRRVEYRGVVVEEMDTDAILARDPDRRPGRRAGPHERARVGADEALGGRRTSSSTPGIDVVSTCNIQHLDSVADAVATITGAPGQRADPRRGPGRGRRGRARRHEPVRAPPADAPRQRLSRRTARGSRSTGSSPSRT